MLVTDYSSLKAQFHYNSTQHNTLSMETMNYFVDENNNNNHSMDLNLTSASISPHQQQNMYSANQINVNIKQEVSLTGPQQQQPQQQHQQQQQQQYQLQSNSINCSNSSSSTVSSLSGSNGVGLEDFNHTKTLIQLNVNGTTNYTMNHASTANQLVENQQQVVSVTHSRHAPSQTTTTTSNQQAHQPKPRGRRKKIRTEPIRPICPQCEKQFSNQSALTKHKLTHSDERKFACQQCSKAFKRHDHLTGHMQTHSNRKPFNCTIQGCDKTYCDARSLRRHKENIHHIITPKSQTQQEQQSVKGEDKTNSQGEVQETSPTSAGLNNQQQQVNCGYNATADVTNINGSTSSLVSAINDERTQLQPLQQQQNQQPQQQSVSSTTFNDLSSSSHIQPLATRSNPQSLTFSNPGPLHQQRWSTSESLEQSHHQNYHHHQPPYSAHEYATSRQHFSFDFENVNNQQLSSFENSNGNTAPNSADSITDSGLGLSLPYEQSRLAAQTPALTNGYATPTTLHPPSSAPSVITTNNGTQHCQAPQQSLIPPQSAPPVGYSSSPSVDLQTHYYNATNTITVPPPSFISSSGSSMQPSHLLRRRIQRLHSYPGHQSTVVDNTNPTLIDLNRRSSESIQQQTHHQQQQFYHQQASLSADYASTQQFSFDFDHNEQQQLVSSTTFSDVSCSDHLQPLATRSNAHTVPFGNSGTLPQQRWSTSDSLEQSHQQNYHQHRPPYSAHEYVTSHQHFSFDFESANNQQLTVDNSNGNTAPNSADSITDSGLGLNVQYEQPRLTTQTPGLIESGHMEQFTSTSDYV